MELPVLSGDLFETTNYEDDFNIHSADAQRISNTDETNWIEYLNSIRNSQSILEIEAACEVIDQQIYNTPNARGVYQEDLNRCKFGPPLLSELESQSSDVEEEVIEIMSISSEEIQDDDDWPDLPEGCMEVLDAIEEMLELNII